MFKLGLILTILTLAAVACGVDPGASASGPTESAATVTPDVTATATFKNAVATAVAENEEANHFEVVKDVAIEGTCYGLPDLMKVTGTFRNNGAPVFGLASMSFYNADGDLVMEGGANKEAWKRDEVWHMAECVPVVDGWVSVELDGLSAG